MPFPVELIKKRADLYRQIRSFFYERGVIEADVPLLSQAAVSDLYIESIEAVIERHGLAEKAFLITSPEFFMKRLLAAGSPAIYYLGKVFRQGEHGSRHHHEFTMLEWYRPDWDEHRLMLEIIDLIALVIPGLPVRKVTYAEIFDAVANLDPHTAKLGQLRDEADRLCRQQHLEANTGSFDENDCLDFIFSHFVEPTLQGLTLVYDYPASQAALAQLFDVGGYKVARRFEVFIDDVEVGNGYYELTDANEQLGRFERDQVRRRETRRPIRPLDYRLLDSLRTGLPPCSGVALGVDRLLMKALNVKAIQDTGLFTDQ